MLGRIWVTFLVTAALSTCLIHYVMGSTQQVTFYEGADCLGRSEVVDDESKDLSGTWMATGALSMHIVGIWKINIQTEKAVVPIINDNTKAPLGRCVQRSEWAHNGWEKEPINGVERLGPRDTTTAQLILYPSKGFSGQPYSVNGNASKTSQMTFQSFIHFSNDVWTVYPEEEYGGKPIYLYPSDREEEVTENGTIIITYPNVDGFSYGSSSLIYAGSIRKGEVKYDNSDGVKITVGSVFLLITTSIVTLVTF